MDEQSTRKERREQNRQSGGGSGHSFNWGFTALLLLVVAGMIGLFVAGERGARAPGSSGEVVSQQGVHWDPTVKILINGEEQTIPANLGLTGGHNPIHTHDSSGLIHFEYGAGPITKDQLTLGKFFALWGKTFNSEQILTSRSGGGGRVSMLVNGQPNTEFERYSIKDKDQIEIRYE